MSLVAAADTHPVLSEANARELTDTIKRTVQIVDSQITRAYFGRAWSALGYQSWDAYCEAEFDGAKLRMPREERQIMVGSLRDAGMSIRAIAAATGVVADTARRDISGVRNRTPETDPDTDVIEAEVVELGEISHQPKVTGIDGRSYPASKPSAPRRSPLTDAADRAGWDLRKATERVERIFADDRFSTNRDQMATPLRSHLTNTIEVCQDLLDQLDSRRGDL